MLFVSEQGEFLKKVKNTKNPCKLFTYRGLFWVPGGTRTYLVVLIIPYLGIIY